MNRPIDCDDENLFKYVYSVIEGEGQKIYMPDGSFRFDSMIAADPGLALETFEVRYNENKIPTCYTYEQYIADKDLQTVIRSLGLDADAFWIVTIFCMDYALNRCNGIKFGDSTREILEDFLSVAASAGEQDSGKTQLILKTGKSKITLTDGKALNMILQWVRHAYDAVEDKSELSVFDKSDIRKNILRCDESDSVLIWYFASLMRYFFKLNPQFKAESKSSDGLSLSKNLLISTIVFNLGLSHNPSFKESDETLKGFFKQYKNKKLNNMGSVYFM